MKCPNCQEELVDLTNCAKCGWKQAESANPPVSSPPANPPNTPEEGASPTGGDSDPNFSPIPEPIPTEQLETGGSDTEANSVVAVEGDQIAQKVLSRMNSALNNQGANTSVGRDQIGLQINLPLEKQRIDEARFSEVTDLLPPKPDAKYEFNLDELDTHFASLERQRLILIGCPDSEIAMDASYALIEKLAINDDERKRRLDLQRHIKEGRLIGTRSFLPDKNNAKGKTAIRVNALYGSAQNRLDTLIRDADRFETFKRDLQDHKVYLLWIVQLKYLDERSNDLNTPQWKIPFLLPLLKRHFNGKYQEIEQRILRQREEGWWPEDESDFCSEIISCIGNGQLIKRLEERERPRPPISAKSIFRDEDYIEKSILYLATYFRKLTPKEFCCMVEALLGERKVTEHKQSDEQGLELVHTRIEKSIVEEWRENKDPFMWKHLCETDSVEDSIKVINFSDNRLRGSLKSFLEEERRFFVKDQFKTLHNQGFLFYNSDRVAENMISLSCEVAADYPDEFNTEWLVEIIVRVKGSLESVNSDYPPDEPIIQFMKGTPSGALALAYSRISELMRRLLKEPCLKNFVTECLAELMRSRRHDAVFSLVGRLRFAPGIDDLYWIKQLLDQADSGTRLLAYSYLYNYMKKLGAKLFEPDNILERWLPGEDREANRYPNSSRYALCALIEYLLETVTELNPKSYGAWPTNYALFAFEDEDAAANTLNQVMRWLFHPAMGQALQQIESDTGIMGTPQSPNTIVGALIAEWFFIFLGPYQKESISSAQNGGGDSNEDDQKDHSIVAIKPGFDAAALANILIRQVAQVASKDQRRELIEYWEFFRSALGDLIKYSNCSSALRAQLIWKNNRLWELIKSLKSLS